MLNLQPQWLRQQRRQQQPLQPQQQRRGSLGVAVRHQCLVVRECNVLISRDRTHDSSVSANQPNIAKYLLHSPPSHFVAHTTICSLRVFIYHLLACPTVMPPTQAVCFPVGFSYLIGFAVISTSLSAANVLSVVLSQA